MSSNHSSKNGKQKQTILQAFLEHKEVLAGYLAQRFLSADHIEDVLQDTFCQTLDASTKKRILSPKSYMFIIASV